MILEFIQVINQERPVRLYHLVFYKFTKLRDYISVFNVRKRLFVTLEAL